MDCKDLEDNCAPSSSLLALNTLLPLLLLLSRRPSPWCRGGGVGPLLIEGGGDGLALCSFLKGGGEAELSHTSSSLDGCEMAPLPPRLLLLERPQVLLFAPLAAGLRRDVPTWLKIFW